MVVYRGGWRERRVLEPSLPVSHGSQPGGIRSLAMSGVYPADGIARTVNSPMPPLGVIAAQHPHDHGNHEVAAIPEPGAIALLVPTKRVHFSFPPLNSRPILTREAVAGFITSCGALGPMRTEGGRTSRAEFDAKARVAIRPNRRRLARRAGWPSFAASCMPWTLRRIDTASRVSLRTPAGNVLR